MKPDTNTPEAGTQSRTMYDNENYSVTCRPDHAVERYSIEQDGTLYTRFYEVVNKDTNVVEYRTASLPGAIGTAAAWNAALVQQVWKWHENSPRVDEADLFAALSSVKDDDDNGVH